MNTHLIDLLRYLHAKKGVSKLLEKGLLYSQISELIATAQQEQLITYNEDDRLELTSRGVRLLLSSKAGLAHGWIEPMDGQRIPKLDTFAPYVPNRRVLNKLRQA